MFKKKQLLPKDLAARAEKLDPAKVEAEVLRILSAKPKQASQPWWPGQMLQAGDWQRAFSQEAMREMERQAQQAREIERRALLQQQNMGWQLQQQVMGSLQGTL